jgi:hypothetical protein
MLPNKDGIFLKNAKVLSSFDLSGANLRRSIMRS